MLVAGNLSGWVLKDIANGHESKCIKEVVDTISNRLHPVTSSASADENLIGIEARVEDLKSKLRIGLGGVHIIGIWGVGGGGKTTLASSIYDEISNKFDSCCFVKNVRRESSNKHGLENLQVAMLSDVLKQKQVQVGRVEEGRRMIKDRLHHRKVLIVLDDVDNLEQLEELAGSRDWFGEGSRIIITTRDEHVLTAHKVDSIHKIFLLNNDEAMKLFCKHAPCSNKHIEDYEELSKDVVTYAGGLPLALRVLGCFLCDKDMNEWRSALARLKEIPDANILEKLKISFDELAPVEKDLFLDIACFFRGKHTEEWVMMILDACGFHPDIGIKVLIQKALITISDGIFDMHDLVQEMAHYVVRGEHHNNPEKYSRVWKKEDVVNICAIDVAKLDKIEAINFRCATGAESQHFLQGVAKMKKLRWIDLKIYGRKNLSVEVGVETAHALPNNFPQRELCCLTLSDLEAKQLWEGFKYLPNLRMIKLDGLKSLIMTPDFDGLPNLQTFMVNGSPYLQEIHPSFGNLEKLVCVAIESCCCLKMLPPIAQSKNIETLILSRCTGIFNLSKIQQNMDNLQYFHIGLQFFQKGLMELDLSYCNFRDEDISSAVWELPNLKELDLAGNKFSRLSFSLLQLPRLKWLNLSDCNGLIELLELPSSIAVLIADDCPSLESFGDISNCKWLWKVSLRGKNKLGLLGGGILLRSMLKGNAKDHFISVTLSHIDIWRRFVARLDFGKTFTLQLPHDWYTDFSGILMFIKSGKQHLHVNITIKRGIDQDFRSELWQESNETLDTRYYETCVGYVSFSSLRHTGCLNSTYNLISFSLASKSERLYRADGWFGAALVPRKSIDDQVQTTRVATNCSESWDEEDDNRKTFSIQHDSKNSINIIWNPYKLHVLTNPFQQVTRTGS